MNDYLLATVVSVGTTGLELRLDGESNARVKEYKCLGSYVPTVNDRVMVVAISGTYVVMGNVVSAPSSGGGVADAAKKLETARNIRLQGDVSGNVNFDGSANVIITVDGLESNRAYHVQNQNSTSEGSDIYFRVGSNKLNFRVGTAGTWYVITSA